MRRWLVRLLIGLSVLAVIAALGTWLLSPEAVPVRVVLVEQGRVEETVTNSRAGTVKARIRSHMSPEIGGRVAVINYRRGDRVKAGAVILKLDDSLQRAQLLLAEREHVVAEAKSKQACLEADRAKRKYNRHKELSVEEIISADLLENLQNASQTAEAACRAAHATVDRAQAAIKEAEAALKKTVLYAPFDAVIADMDIELGEWTTPSPPGVPMPAILDLIDPSAIYVSAPMDEVDSARILPSQQVRITLDPYPDKHFPGHVKRVAPYVLDVEEQNRTVEIDVEFTDKSFAATLLPGTSADVEVILSVRENVLRIPTTTLLEGNKVFVVRDGRLAEVSVAHGLKNWDYVEITSGLTAGEAVVTSLEHPDLLPGTPVDLQAEPVVP